MKVSSTIGSLSSSNDYKNHLVAVNDSLSSSNSSNNDSDSKYDFESSYQLMLESNRMLKEMDEEIQATHKFVSELYSKKFPELEALVPQKIDYIKTVKIIGNEMDLTLVDLNSVLSSSLVMIVAVAGSTTDGQQLSEFELNECFRGCDEILRLDKDKMRTLTFIESMMNKIAPNLCAMTGSSIAAQLIGLAGGLQALAQMPACNVQVMGQQKSFGMGLSNIAASNMPHIGILHYCDLVQSCPPFLRRKALKMMAGKVSLAARVDCHQSSVSHLADVASADLEGVKLRREMEEKIQKLQEPSKAKTKKALPLPEEKKRAKRGGKRIRKMKERFAVTDLQKLQNKMEFKPDGGEYGDSAMGFDNGMVGSKDTGRLRAPQMKESKLKGMVKKQKKAVTVSSGATSGMSSSLVFTHEFYYPSHHLSKRVST